MGHIIFSITGRSCKSSTAWHPEDEFATRFPLRGPLQISPLVPCQRAQHQEATKTATESSHKPCPQLLPIFALTVQDHNI